MSDRYVFDPETFQTYNYQWNQDEEPTWEQQQSILEKERERRRVQIPLKPPEEPPATHTSIVNGLRESPPEVEEGPLDWFKRKAHETIEDIRQNFASTVHQNALEMAANEERYGAKDVERLGTLMQPIADSPIGKVVGLSAEPTTKERYPGIIERQPGEPAGIPELRPAGPEAPVDELAARRRAAGRSTIDFATDPTNLALMAITAVEPQMAPLIGMGFGAPMATESAVSMTEKGLRGELPNSEDVARMGVGLALSGGLGPLKDVAEVGARKIIPEVRDFAEFANPFREGPLGAEAGVFQWEGLPPTEWMVRNGYRMKKGGWFNDEGKLTPTDQINAEYKADQAARAVAPPETTFVQPDKQLGFEEWRNQPENQKFYGGKLSPERMKTALTDYNNYATEFAKKKASTSVSSAPQSVEEAMGDVGEIPLDFGQEAPIADIKPTIEEPVPEAPVVPESVQPVNELASPELQAALAEATQEMTVVPEQFRAGLEALPPVAEGQARIFRGEGAEQKAGGGWAAQNPAEAASYLKGHWGEGATGEGRLLSADIPEAALDAIAERRGVPREALGELTPEELAQYAPEWRDVNEPAPITAEPDLVELAKKYAAENPVEPAPNQAAVDAAHEASLAEAAAPEPTGDFVKDVLERPIPEAKPAEPTGDFAKDVLEQPIPEETVAPPKVEPEPAPKPEIGSEGTVQQPSGTIAAEASNISEPSQPGKTVPAPETIVQEASTTPPAEPTPAPVTSPTPEVVRKLALDSVLEEMYPGKESFTKADITAARKELMARLRGAKGAKAAAKTEALHQAVEAEVPPGTTPPTPAPKGQGEAPKLPLGSPGLLSRITLDLRTNLGKIHPHLAKWVDKFQREAELPAMSAIAERRTITEGLSKPEQNAVWRMLDEKGAEELAVARELKDQRKINDLLQQDPSLKDVAAALDQNPQLVEKTVALRDLLDEVHKRAEANKVAVGYRQHYAPHYFKEGGFRPNVQPRATPRTGTMTRRMSKLEKQRLTMRKDYIKDLNVLDEYFMQAYQRISEAENFGKRHEKIARWFEQTQGVDPRVAQYFDKGIQRITGNEEPSWIRGALGKGRRIQALSDLGLAAPLQLGQASHTSAYGGVMRTLEAAKDLTKGQREIAMRALRGGALTPDIGIESLGAARGGGVTSGKFLWGIPTMDKVMRVHAFRVGELLHRDAVAGDAGAIRSLKRLGIQDVSKVTADQVGTALSNKTQFKTGHLDLPLWSTSPLGRTATMYTSFMYQHTKFMGQLFKNPIQNAPAIARFALVGALAGEGVGDIRAVLKGRNPVEDERFRKKEAKWIDTLRNRRIPWSDPAKRLIQNYALLGGVGIFQTYFERLNSPDVTLAGVAGGPIASNAEELLRDASQPKKGKDKLRSVGRWGLQQLPVFGYEIGEEVFPYKKKRSADPLLDPNY